MKQAIAISIPAMHTKFTEQTPSLKRSREESTHESSMMSWRCGKMPTRDPS
jgi:hypothetical protein